MCERTKWEPRVTRNGKCDSHRFTRRRPTGATTSSRRNHSFLWSDRAHLPLYARICFLVHCYTSPWISRGSHCLVTTTQKDSTSPLVPMAAPSLVVSTEPNVHIINAVPDKAVHAHSFNSESPNFEESFGYVCSCWLFTIPALAFLAFFSL